MSGMGLSFWVQDQTRTSAPVAFKQNPKWSTIWCAVCLYPREKSIRRFMDQVRQRTQRRVPLKTEQLIAELNPLLRGWGEYFKRAHVRKLFNRLLDRTAYLVASVQAM